MRDVGLQTILSPQHDLGNRRIGQQIGEDELILPVGQLESDACVAEAGIPHPLEKLPADRASRSATRPQAEIAVAQPQGQPDSLGIEDLVMAKNRRVRVEHRAEHVAPRARRGQDDKSGLNRSSVCHPKRLAELTGRSVGSLPPLHLPTAAFTVRA